MIEAAFAILDAASIEMEAAFISRVTAFAKRDAASRKTCPVLSHPVLLLDTMRTAFAIS